ncbi:MAG: type II toxin-antitoxin system CcdA family antitoxin [Acidimicrobiia bacterium]
MRVNITVPDDIAADAKAVGLNVSRVATAALVEELDRRRKIAALDDYLARLEADLGPIPADEAAEAAQWADELVTAALSSTAARRRRRSA